MRVEHKGDLASLRPLADSKNELGLFIQGVY